MGLCARVGAGGDPKTPAFKEATSHWASDTLGCWHTSHTLGLPHGLRMSASTSNDFCSKAFPGRVYRMHCTIRHASRKNTQRLQRGVILGHEIAVCPGRHMQDAYTLNNVVNTCCAQKEFMPQPQACERDPHAPYKQCAQGKALSRLCVPCRTAASNNFTRQSAYQHSLAVLQLRAGNSSTAPICAVCSTCDNNCTSGVQVASKQTC